MGECGYSCTEIEKCCVDKYVDELQQLREKDKEMFQHHMDIAEALGHSGYYNTSETVAEIKQLSERCAEYAQLVDESKKWCINADIDREKWRKRAEAAEQKCTELEQNQCPSVNGCSAFMVEQNDNKDLREILEDRNKQIQQFDNALNRACAELSNTEKCPHEICWHRPADCAQCWREYFLGGRGND